MTTPVAPAPVRDRVCRDPTRVPWTTVLPLAVVGAFGSGFWVVALRGAVGSIERVGAPFVSWLRESTVLLPVYVFAVLAALTLASRWFGPRPQRSRMRTLVTLLLVVAAVTIAGVGVLSASSLYDYLLQSSHLATMPAMDSACDATCTATRQDSTRALQVHAVGLGSVLVLVTNLVLLGLLVALRGGRIELVARGRRGSPERLARPDRLRLVLGASLLGSAAIHAGVAPEHLSDWAAAGVFFLALSFVQGVLAALVVTRTSEAVVWAALIVSEATIVLWLVSRTVGMPFGPGADAAEPLGVADMAATVLEAAALVSAVAMLRGREWLRARCPSPQLGRLALVALLAVSVAGLGSSLSAFGGPGLPSPHDPAGSSANGTASVDHARH